MPSQNSKLKSLKETIISDKDPYLYNLLAEQFNSPEDTFKSQRASETFINEFSPFRNSRAAFLPCSPSILERLNIDKNSLINSKSSFIQSVALEELTPILPRHFVFHHTFKTAGSLLRDHIITSSSFFHKIDSPICMQASRSPSSIRLVPPVLQSPSAMQALTASASRLPEDANIEYSFIVDHCLPTDFFYNDLIDKMRGKVSQFSFYRDPLERIESAILQLIKEGYNPSQIQSCIKNKDIRLIDSVFHSWQRMESFHHSSKISTPCLIEMSSDNIFAMISLIISCLQLPNLFINYYRNKRDNFAISRHTGLDCYAKEIAADIFNRHTSLDEKIAKKHIKTSDQFLSTFRNALTTKKTVHPLTTVDLKFINSKGEPKFAKCLVHTKDFLSWYNSII